jgi:ABC-2 type transport system permease protein
MNDREGSARSGKLRRVWALVVKESRQIVRDPSSIAIGVVMPVMLILMFGFALSLDVKNAPVAVVLEDSSAPARELAAGFTLSPYFNVTPTGSMRQAEALMLDHRVNGIIRIPADFARRVARGDAEVQIVLHGTDANTARIVEAYAGGAVAQWTIRQLAEGDVVTAGGPVGVQSRMWFNEANDSHYFLVPGLIVLIITLIGAFLTALVVAREWERGTLEALLVTPVRSDEILLGKIIPYFVLGMIGFALCILAAEFLFKVPLRGSLFVLTIVSMLYLLVALGIGLVASALTRSQFVASQIALLATFLPAMMLSGFLFDLRSMPFAVQLVTYVLPARYFVALLQTIFLAGDIWSVILPNAAVLAGMAAGLMLLARISMRKRLA